MTNPTYRIGIDVGGTFTDVVLLDEVTGRFHVVKAVNASADRAQTVAAAISRAIVEGGIDPGQVSWISHGTTITTNAVIERSGARTALITNRGFRDVLEIGRFNRPPELIYKIHTDRPAPLVPRALRLEVDCRIDAHGKVTRDIDEADVEAVLGTLREEKVAAVAICFLFSFKNAQHEEMLKKRIEQALPGVAVLASHEVLPEFREYPRTSTTVFASYVAPVLRRYIGRLIRNLTDASIAAPLYIFQSNGGIARSDVLMRNPALTLLSGPSGAVIGAAKLCAAIGYPRIVTMDIGGTSLDICIVNEQGVETTNNREIDLQPVSLPMMNIQTVGAGGGSVVQVDRVGRVTVGPRSMGASPGPACYGNGGDQATLTDVNLLLGFINPRTFANGEVPLFIELAEKAIADRLAVPLGLSPVQAAKGVYRVAVNQMADAIQKASLDGGHDIRKFVLVAFGGSGPLHACGVARVLGIPKVLIPIHPGLFSARGIGMSSFQHDYARSVIRPLVNIRPDEIEKVFDELLDEANGDLAIEQIDEDRRRITRSVDLRYYGQSSEINVPLGANVQDYAGVAAAFHKLHEDLYSYKVESEPIELVNVRVRAIGHVADVPSERLEEGVSPDPVPYDRRSAHQPDQERPIEFAIYRRSDLRYGHRFSGPAIIEEQSSSTVVPANCDVEVDLIGNLIIGIE